MTLLKTTAFPQQYLVPQSITASGVEADKMTISDEAMNTLIKQYCRESGVRNLQKQIEKVIFVLNLFK